MDKVWLVFSGPLDYKGGKRDICHGVFSTLEKARKCASYFLDQGDDGYKQALPDMWRSGTAYVMVKEYPLDWFQ